MIRARSGDCCEVCGLANYSEVQRTKDGNYFLRLITPGTTGGIVHLADGRPSINRETAIKGADIEFEKWKCDLTKIILTVAHLNHDETDNRPENLAHLCQLHHNRHDAKHRAANRKAAKS
jgi:hypothetical protein